MDVSVIIVSYNSAELIQGCLDSVVGQREVSTETIVIDNASADKTLSVLQAFGAKVRVIANGENAGFGRACNQGFEASKGRYVYFLNPDAQLIASDALASLCRKMDEHPSWGMAGTRVVSADGGVKKPANEYPDQRHVRKYLSQLPGKIAWVVGASMIVR